MNPDSPANVSPQSAQKQIRGLVRASWFIIAFVLILSLVPFLGFGAWFIGGPLLFITLIMGVIVLARGGTGSGLIILFTSMIFAPLFILVAPFISSFLGLAGTGAALEAKQKREQSARPSSTSTPQPRASVSQSQSQSKLPMAAGSPVAATTITDLYRDGLESVEAPQIIVARQAILGRNIARRPIPVFSPDGKSVLYAVMPNSGAIRQLLIADLATLSVKQTVSLQFDCEKTAWSPDLKRFLYQDSNGNLHIVDLANRSEVALPLQQGKFQGYDGRPIWSADKTVTFVVSRSGANWIDDLNLDDLTLRRRNVANGKPMEEEFDRLFASGGAHARAYIYAGSPPERIANPGIAVNDAYLMVANRDGSYARVLRKNVGSNTTLCVSKDIRHLIVFDSADTTVLYLGVRPKPPMLLSVDLGTLQVKPEKRQDYDLYRQLRVPFRASVYAPATNPLNGKQIGPDRNRVKGRVEVVTWNSDSALTRPTLEFESLGDGDVAADFRSDGEAKHFGNRQFSFGDEWRVLRQTDSRSTAAEINSQPKVTSQSSPFESVAATEAEPIAADDFCAHDVERFLEAVKRRDFRDALGRVSPAAKGNDLALAELQQFLTADKSLRDIRAYRVLSHRLDGDGSRLVAEVTDSIGQRHQVAFTLWHEVEEEEREGCDIKSIVADRTYSSPAAEPRSSIAQAATDTPNTDTSWKRPGEEEGAAVDAANAEIDKVYRSLLTKLPPEKQEALKDSQRSWIKWRDAEAERITKAGGATGGSAYRVDFAVALLELIHKRTTALNGHLQSIERGDIPESFSDFGPKVSSGIGVSSRQSKSFAGTWRGTVLLSYDNQYGSGTTPKDHTVVVSPDQKTVTITWTGDRNRTPTRASTIHRNDGLSWKYSVHLEQPGKPAQAWTTECSMRLTGQDEAELQMTSTWTKGPFVGTPLRGSGVVKRPASSVPVESTSTRMPETGARLIGMSVREGEATNSQTTTDSFASFVTRHEMTEKTRDLEDILRDYHSVVDYYDNGRVDREFIRKDKLQYFQRWPGGGNEIVGPVTATDLGNGRWLARYRVRFHVNNSKGEWIRGEADNEVGATLVGGNYYINYERGKIVNREKGFGAAVGRED